MARGACFLGICAITRVQEIPMKSLAIVAMAAAFSSLAAVPAARAAAGPLDGKRFVGETGEVGKEKGEKEEFVFKDGTFDPIGCHQYGFTAAAYSAAGEGKTV